jgi:hypothetical protein
MALEIQVGVPSYDHFSVFEDDGYSKHTGLTSLDFSTTVYRDSVPVAVPVTIDEIGTTGEYDLSFVPTSEAAWDVEVLCRFNDEIYVANFVAKTQTSTQVLSELLAQMASLEMAVGRVLGLLHYNAMVDMQQYDVNTQLTYARLRVFDQPSHVPAVPNGSETLGKMHEYTINATYAGIGVLTGYSLKRIL